jgi:hypothetical protein
MCCILSSAYWAPIQYYTKIYRFNQIRIERYETYPKQTYRNRCQLYGPNGIQALQVPVKKGSFHKTLIRDLTIDYETPWQKNHLKTIESAYSSSPFFEFYIDDIAPFYAKKYKFLIDLNHEILSTTLAWFEIEKQINFTDEFCIVTDGPDFRNTIHPKKSKQVADAGFMQEPYLQGFEQRHGFIPNLSILDLVFNTGPEAYIIIKTSTR